jgi:hypothetical protein
MDRWEFCYVDLIRHEITYLTSEGLEHRRVKKDRMRKSDTKDDATARFIAALGREGWEMTNGFGDIRPVFFFKRKLPPEE